MELQIISPQESGFVKEIVFNNEELKAEIAAKMADYNSLVFTEETIKEAKQDRANLRKLKDAIESERKRIKKLCNEPYVAFEAKVKEITALIDEPIGLIDAQIKEVEEKKKEEKEAQIRAMFSEIDFAIPLDFEDVFQDKWLNATVSLKSIREELEEKEAQIRQDLETLDNLAEFSFEAKEAYKETHNINTAIAAAKRMAEIQKRKEEAQRRNEELAALAEQKKAQEEAQAAEEKEVAKEDAPEERVEMVEVSFRIHATLEQLQGLKNYLVANHIAYEPID